jgi:hypothetical protein
VPRLSVAAKKPKAPEPEPVVLPEEDEEVRACLAAASQF